MSGIPSVKKIFKKAVKVTKVVTGYNLVKAAYDRNKDKIQLVVKYAIIAAAIYFTASAAISYFSAAGATAAASGGSLAATSTATATAATSTAVATGATAGATAATAGGVAAGAAAAPAAAGVGATIAANPLTSMIVAQGVSSAVSGYQAGKQADAQNARYNEQVARDEKRRQERGLFGFDYAGNRGVPGGDKPATGLVNNQIAGNTPPPVANDQTMKPIINSQQIAPQEIAPQAINPQTIAPQQAQTAIPIDQLAKRKNRSQLG